LYQATHAGKRYNLIKNEILAVRFPQRANGGNKKEKNENEKGLSSTYDLRNRSYARRNHGK
jgi:hypothetical protein